LAVFGRLIEILGHGGKGKFARKHRTHGKSGVSSPRDASANYSPPPHWQSGKARSKFHANKRHGQL
jgi:hypothetical protein